MLIGATLLEVSETVSKKLSEGFSRMVPSVLLFFIYVMSFILLVFALKRIEISIAYSVWSGLGTVMVGVIGMVYFAEGFNWFKIVCLCLIIMGVIGLYLGETS